MEKSWAQEAMEDLTRKGKENWTEDDWETYCYIENVNAESDYYDQLD